MTRNSRCARMVKRGLTFLATVSVLAPTIGFAASSNAAASTQTIKVWLGDPVSPQTVPYVQGLANQYEKVNPGVSIQLTLLSDANAHQQYITAIAGNSTPCIGLVGNTWTPEFAGLGALVPIGPTASQLYKTYVKSMVDSATYEGKVYGYPYDVGVRALIYRKDLFAKANLAVPKTWSQLVSDAVKLQDDNPGVYGFGMIGGNQWYYLPMVWEWGGQIATRADGKWQSQMNSKAAVAAYEYYAQMLSKDHLSPASAESWQGSNADSAFALGDVATMIGGAWDLQAILADKTSMKSEIGTALIPVGPAGNDDTFAGGSNLVVFKNCKDQGDADAFIQYMLQTPNVTHLTSQLGLFPATLTGVNDSMKPGAAYSTAPWRTFALMVPHSRAVPEASTWGAVESSNDLINAMQALMGGGSATSTMQQLSSQMSTILNGKTT